MTAISGHQNVWYKKNTHYVVHDYSSKPCCSSPYLHLGINFQSTRSVLVQYFPLIGHSNPEAKVPQTRDLRQQ